MDLSKNCDYVLDYKDCSLFLLQFIKKENNRAMYEFVMNQASSEFDYKHYSIQSPESFL